MKAKSVFSVLVGASALLWGAVGCTPKTDVEEVAKSPAAVAPDDVKLEVVAEEEMPAEAVLDDTLFTDLLQNVDELVNAGKTNEANQVFQTALDDAKYKDFRPSIFDALMRYYLFTEQFDDAKMLYLNALRTDPEIAQAGFDTIYGAYISKGDLDGALDWAKTLANQEVGEDFRLTAVGWLLTGLAEKGDVEALKPEVAKAIEKLDVAACAKLFDRIAQMGFEKDQVAIADCIVEAIQASEKKGEADYAQLLLTLAIRKDAAQKAWQKIADRMPSLIESVPDLSLQSALRFAYQTAQAAQRYDVVDAMAAAVVLDERAASMKRTMSLSARMWVNALFQGDADGVSAYPARLARLLQNKVDATTVYAIYSRHFYAILDNPAILKECQPLAEQLLPLLKEAPTQNALRALQLDAAFVLEDYATALTLLEKGIPEREEEWHKMAIIKVKAHLALKEKRYDDAVASFREFMKLLPEEPQPDPTSDVVFTKLTLLGDNEKRIGDIYTTAEKSEEAKKAYAAAQDWYEKALKENTAGDATAAYIQAKMDALPKVEAPAEVPKAEAPAEAPKAEAPKAETPAEAPAAEPAA